MKQFVKSCSVASYCRKIKQLLEKINQNSEHIQNERKKVSFNLSDFKEIEAWQTTIKNNGTPLLTFYDSWKKIINAKKRKFASENDELGDLNLPKLKKHKKKDITQEELNKPVELFPSDSESDNEETADVKVVNDKPKRKNNKKVKRQERAKVINSNYAFDNGDDGNYEADIVKDFDWDSS